MAEEKKLIEKLEDWVNKYGYPLEFETANIFRGNRFQTRQGIYVTDTKTNSPKEIDVLASIHRHRKGIPGSIRIEFLVECKTNKDKPWIVFSDKKSKIDYKDFINNLITNSTMELIMQGVKDMDEIRGLSMFTPSETSGFNGVTSLIDKNDKDRFYSTFQSIISNCNSRRILSEYTENPLRLAKLFIPIVVVESIFNATYSEDEKKLKLEKTEHIKIHWRGAENSKLTTVDLVSINYLNEFTSELYKQYTMVADVAYLILEKLKESKYKSFFNHKDIPMDIKNHPLYESLVKDSNYEF